MECHLQCSSCFELHFWPRFSPPYKDIWYSLTQSPDWVRVHLLGTWDCILSCYIWLSVQSYSDLVIVWFFEGMIRTWLTFHKSVHLDILKGEKRSLSQLDFVNMYMAKVGFQGLLLFPLPLPLFLCPPPPHIPHLLLRAETCVGVSEGILGQARRIECKHRSIHAEVPLGRYCVCVWDCFNPCLNKFKIQEQYSAELCRHLNTVCFYACQLLALDLLKVPRVP